MAHDRMSIGKFSLLTRIPIKLLRSYDERGILVPTVKDRFTQYRYYTRSQVARGVAIRILGEIGFSLPEISAILTARKYGEPKFQVHLR